MIFNLIGSIKFVVTDNFSGGKEIDSIIQGISYTEQGKGVISYEVEGDEDKSREINYDRNKWNDKMSIARTRSKHKWHKSLQPNEISIHGLEKIKTLKPFKYPNTNENSNNESHIKSQRYVDMIRRVMSKLTELKSIKESKEKNKDNKENDDTDYIDILKDPSVLIDLMDPNFDIIKPNIDYFIEEKYNSKIENSKIAKLGKPSISSNRFFNVKKQKIFENRKHIDSKYSKYYIDPTLRFLIYLTNTELK